MGGSVGIFDSSGEEEDGLALFRQSLRIVLKRHVCPGGTSAENKRERENQRQQKSIFHGLELKNGVMPADAPRSKGIWRCVELTVWKCWKCQQIAFLARAANQLPPPF